MEHITSTMGISILTGKLLKSDNPVVDMWKWHSLEEVEHKSVSHDVYKAINGSNKVLRVVMKLALIEMGRNTIKIAIKMLRHDKQFWKLSTFKGMFKFFFSKNGALRINYADYKSFFDNDFNPETHGSDLDLTPWKERFGSNQFV
jgi:predicted metal-dependent hydrolase